MISEEERLEQIKVNNKHSYCDKNDVDFLLNLIEKQNKKLEEKEKLYKKALSELVIADKMVNYMANYINDNTPYTKDTKDLENEYGIRSAKYTTEYFRKKVENG